MELDIKENRLFQASIALIVIFSLVFAVTNVYLGKKKKIVLRKRAELEAFSGFRADYEGMAGIIEPFKSRAAVTRPNIKVEKVLGDIGEALGIKEKMGSFKTVAAEASKGYMKKASEVTLTGITLNELVNFLYRVEGNRNMLMVKSLSLKPAVSGKGGSGGELLNIKLSVEIMSKMNG